MRTIAFTAATAAILSASPAAAWTANPATYDHAKGEAECVVLEPQEEVIIVVIQARTVDGEEPAFMGVVTFAADSNHGRVHSYSPLYAAVDDHQRFSGDQGTLALTPELLAALRSGTRLYLSWSSSHEEGPDQASANLDGFGEAYDACAADLNATLKRERTR